MTITTSRSDFNSVQNCSQGRYLNSGTAEDLVLSLGFTPRYVCVENLTDHIKYEWYEGMAAGTTVKTVATGTRTLDTADVAISVDDGSGDQDGAGSGTSTSIPGIAPSGEVTIAAAVLISAKQITWFARS